MEVQQFEWKEFKMETLHEQIQAGSVSIGFQENGLTVKIHGQAGTDKTRPDKWTIYAVFKEDGKQERTQSRIMSSDGVKLELERSVNSAKAMLALRVPPPKDH